MRPESARELSEMMRFIMIKCVLQALFIVLITVPITLFADDAERDEAIAAVISDQLDAFAKDDEDRAFSHASPSIQLHFDSPGYFMEMVRRSYPMIYRPQSYELGGVRVVPDKIFQTASFVDQKYGRYQVLYEMQQQGDGAWKINGVRVVKSRDVVV